MAKAKEYSVNVVKTREKGRQGGLGPTWRDGCA